MFWLSVYEANFGGWHRAVSASGGKDQPEADAVLFILSEVEGEPGLGRMLGFGCLTWGAIDVNRRER
jgi:hypothetical protein